jgi:transcriptional regulator with XRE-family HTH domain
LNEFLRGYLMREQGRLTENLAKQVKQRRARLGLSQSELAERAGTSVNTIGKVESAKTAASLDTVEKLAAALECDDAPWDLVKPLRTFQQRCKAKVTITESGGPGDEEAEFPDPGYIHARPGDVGTVMYVDAEGIATVRFDASGTATIVHRDEIEFVDEEEE